MLHLRDSLGRLFDNFTSLTVMWSTSDRELAEFVDMTSSVKMMFVKYKEDDNLRRALCMYFASFQLSLSCNTKDSNYTTYNMQSLCPSVLSYFLSSLTCQTKKI